MLTPRRISYAVLVFMLVLAGGLHLGRHCWQFFFPILPCPNYWPLQKTSGSR